jgi:gliding motility-associated-like protein
MVLPGKTIAQNLVPNPSFEENDGCVFWLFGAKKWYSYTAYNSLASGYYYTNNCGNLLKPPYFGDSCFQLPRTGKSLVKIEVESIGDTAGDKNFRDFIACRLLQPLVAGEWYCVSLFVANPETARNCVQSMGAYLTPDSVYFTPGAMVFPYPAQVEFPQWVCDTGDYTLFRMHFQAAGNERYLHIGNFHQSLDYPYYSNPYYHDPFNTALGWNIIRSAAFIDDVSLEPMGALPEAQVREHCPEGSPALAAAHADSARWYLLSNPLQVLSHDTLYQPPPGNQTYLLKAWKCGKEFQDTVALPPCPQLLIPNILTPGNDGLNDVFFIQNLPPATRVELFNRWGNALFKTDNYQNDFTCSNCSGGVYYYVVTTPEGKVHKGYVTVVR